jgi:hypothetical protein
VQVLVVAMLPTTTALCKLWLPTSVPSEAMLYLAWRRGFVRPSGVLRPAPHSRGRRKMH